MRIKRKIVDIIKNVFQYYKVQARNKDKIFVVGRNKTGTTSIKKAFENLGFIVGNQREAEKLQRFYLKNDFKPIIQYCKSAEVFQDYPFSFPETYKHIDTAFPGSKFILTIRDSPEQWCKSVINFQSKIYGEGKTPTKQDLMNANYVNKGWAWRNKVSLYKDPEHDMGSESKLKSHYIEYNTEIIKYFKNRPNDLLVLNLNEVDVYKKFINFIGVKSSFNDFPWKNKTSRIETRK